MATTNAITAIQEYVSTLSDDARVELGRKFGIDDFSKINVMNYGEAERLCKSLNLKYDKGDVWSLYNKGKAAYAEATEKYYIAEGIFANYKNKLNKSKAQYDVRIAQLQAQKSDGSQLTLTERASIANATGYTTKSINETNAKEYTANALLDARRNAVAMQQRGLRAGAAGEFFGLA